MGPVLKWINKSSKDNQKHQTFIQDQNECALCGTDVEIKIEKEKDDFYLHEQVFCPQCQLKTRFKQHKIQ